MAGEDQYTVTVGKAFRERKRRCTLKRMGWQWHRTRRVAPSRVDRHWLVLAVATLWVLAHGPRVEEARHRPLSMFQLGWCQAQRLLHRGYGWARVWQQPLPGPDSPDGLQQVDSPTG